MGDSTRLAELDEITAHELRDQGSLKWTKYDGDTIGAFVAEMDFPVARPIRSALHTAVDEGHFGYLPPRLVTSLTQACARWQLRRYGWQVDPAQIWPVSDVLTAFVLTMEHFSPVGSPVILPTPAYMPFLSTPPRQRREVFQAPMARSDGRYVLDLDRIEEGFRAGGRLLVLCNPANPVGRVFTPAELSAVTELVERYDGVVFADEIHAPVTYPGHRHVPYASTSPTAARHSITALSTSKGWNLPGLRCAQVVVPETLQQQWQRVGTSAAVAPSNLGVVAATAAYRHGEPWLDDILIYLERNRHRLTGLLADALPTVGYTPPEGTYLAWLDCRELVRDQALVAEEPPAAVFQRQAGVALVDGAECGEAGRGFVRLTFATPLPILEQMITRMAHCVSRA